ncbi:MAG: DUF1538 family protein, partial [Candidatus Ornithospirochaeta sp.]
MNFLKQLKEVSLSVLPIVVMASLLGIFYGAFSLVSIPFFLLSSLLLVLGLSLFLLGVDMGFIQIGSFLGQFITRKRNVPLLIFSGLALGVMVTMAEPDVRVLASQVTEASPSFDFNLFVLVIALGVGVFMALSYIRALSRFSLKITLAIGIALMVTFSLFLDEFTLSVGFDSGGATTGPMAVPFIIALGLGVASVHGGREEDSFGFTGIASIGPVLAVLAYGLFAAGGDVGTVEEEAVHGLLPLFFDVLSGVISSLLPLLVLSLLTLFLMKSPKVRTLRIIIGFVYSFVGIVIFLFAVESAFMPLARTLGIRIAEETPFLLVPLGLLFGFAVVLAEPAIWVLTGEVEVKSEGKIRRPLMIGAIAAGTAGAVALSMVRIMADLSLLWFIIPIYGLILCMLPFVPDLFVGIGFDSG